MTNYSASQRAAAELELRRRRAGDPASKALEERILKAYGSREAYEAAKVRAGITPDHAANFERYGVVLQEKQLEFVVNARASDDPNRANEIGYGGARGPGKSFGLMAQLALDDCQRAPGLKVLYLRKTGKAAQEQLEDLVQSVLLFFPNKEAKRDRIDFSNGSRIVLGGFKDDTEALKYQGLEYDIVAIEEATQLTERTYKALRLSSRSSKLFNGDLWRARTYTTTNPLGVGHQWYKKRFVDNERRKEDARRKFIFSTVDDNVFVGTEYVTNLDDLTGAEKRAYRHGDWTISAGAYFEEWNEDLHTVPAFTEIPFNWCVWASMDYGYNHWNVVHLHAKDTDGVIYTFDEICHRKRQPDEIAPDIHALLRKYNLKLDRLMGFYVGADVFRQTGNSRQTVADQYKVAGITLKSADMSPGTRVSGAHLVAKLLGNSERDVPPRWYVAKTCKQLIDCLPYLERDPNNSEDVLKADADENGNGGDDAYDSARYGLSSVVRLEPIKAEIRRYA